MIEDIGMSAEAALELPDCAPTKVLPQDLGKAIEGVEVQKHYASDLFGVQENESISYELFQQMNDSHSSEKSVFVSKVIGLLTENDACDKVGIKFIARVYDSACSQDVNEFGQSLCNNIKCISLHLI